MRGSAEARVHALTLGAWVRHAREGAALTQAQLAQRSGVCQSVLSRVECGTRAADVWELGKVTEALGSSREGAMSAVVQAMALVRRSACALCGVEEAPWGWLTEVLGSAALRALAGAAVRVAQGERNLSAKLRKWRAQQ